MFWSSALHGISGSCLGEGQVDQVRRQVMRSLHLAHAGVNPYLSWGLPTTLTADPGFWRLQLTVRSYVRLLGKEPRLLSLWNVFMSGYNGSQWPFFSAFVVTFN